MILNFPFSKRGRIYAATILMLFFLGKWQTALKADKVTSNEIFASRQQYVVLSHVEPTYYITIIL